MVTSKTTKSSSNRQIVIKNRSNLEDPVWDAIRADAAAVASGEPVLAKPMEDMILQRTSLEEVVALHLSRKLTYLSHTDIHLREAFEEVLERDPEIGDAIRCDLIAINDRDPACPSLLTPLLYFKGFKAITCHRMAHRFWLDGREHLARHIQSLSSEFFSVDIHPAARFGCGILLDHATGFVAGETCTIADDVSILHAVTLGGTGKEKGDRHPKIGSGVLIGAGAKILGNISVGQCAKVGANSVVLEDVPAHSTVAGVPAKVVGSASESLPSHSMNHRLDPGAGAF
ncbi:MAG: serine O-acetyltransferase [Puniceicoccaceae bacterium]